MITNNTLSLLHLGSPPASIDEDKPGFYKKKEENEIFFAGSRRKSKKGRSERRFSLKKGLNHNPEIFQQFSTLGLLAPSSMATVGEVAKQLREKLNQLEIQAAEIKLARLNVADEVTDEVDGRSMTVPEVKVECEKDNNGPPIFIIEPSTPNPEADEELPTIQFEEVSSCLKRSGLCLDLKCHVSQNTLGMMRIPSCDKILKPATGDTTLNIVPTSPDSSGPYSPHCTALLRQNQQNLLINNL